MQTVWALEVGVAGGRLWRLWQPVGREPKPLKMMQSGNRTLQYLLVDCSLQDVGFQDIAGIADWSLLDWQVLGHCSCKLTISRSGGGRRIHVYVYTHGCVYTFLYIYMYLCICIYI